MSNDDPQAVLPDSIATPRLFTDQHNKLVTENYVDIRGDNGERNSFIYLYEAGTHDYLDKKGMFNNPFSVRLTARRGKYAVSFYARSETHAGKSDPSNTITVRFLRPEIAKQNGNPPIEVTHTFSGGGLSGSRVSLHLVAANGSPQMPAIGAGLVSGERWQIKANTDLPSGPIKVIAIAGYGNEESRSEVADFLVTPALLPPVITAPTADSVQNSAFGIYGNGALANDKVVIFKDLGNDTPLGEIEALADTWRVDLFELSSGPISVVAELIRGGKRSGRSNPRAFRIRPKGLDSVTVDPLTITSAKFSGTGHNGAMVEIKIVNGPPGSTPPLVVVVSAEKWETISTNWPVGLYNLSAVQKVSDNAGGWIESLPYTFNVNHVLPDLINIRYTEDYIPIFSGNGLTGAMVRLFNADRTTPVIEAASVNNGEWSRRALVEWGPTLDRAVHGKQYIGDQASSNWIVRTVRIPPLAPDSLTLIENEQSPQISGTCWPSAVVTLEYNNDGVKHRATVSQGTWTFRREQPFTTGVTHTFRVTQRAASQDSPTATGSFTVRRTMLKPQITQPVEGAEVGRSTQIKGKHGMAGATMQVRDAQMGGVLNSVLLERDGDWTIDLKDLNYRTYYLDARQTLDGIDSDPSDPRTCTVVLEPPVVLVPAKDADLPRQSTLSGSGWPGARVTVWLEGQGTPLLRNVLVDGSGHWRGSVSLDDVGFRTLRAQQIFEGQTSRLLLHACRVVPSSPDIESPVRGASVGSFMVVSGFGYPQDTIALRLSDGTPLGTTQVLEDRTWSLPVRIEHPGGPGDLAAVASRGEFDSPSPVPHPLQINTWLPRIDAPAAGRWVSHPLIFAGQGKAGVGEVVSWFNPDVVWAADLAVSDGQWQGEALQELSAGGNWCRFRQSFQAGTDPASASDWAESQRFEVLPPSRSG